MEKEAMHWARVICEKDNPEWCAVMHADGSVTEVKVGLIGDVVHVGITPAGGKRIEVQEGDEQWIRPVVDDLCTECPPGIPAHSEKEGGHDH
jgi:hypothetical protein